MKKILSILTIVLLAAVSAIAQSPSPGIFNYQGVARNSVGNVLINKTITLRLTIRDITAAGLSVYQESRTTVTNPFGLFNVQVGSAGASNVTGTIAGVLWGVNTKFIQVEIDPNGGTTFINIGTAQLASVPYSLYSSLSNDLVLPFNKTQSDAGTLFRVNNSGSGNGIMGTAVSGAGITGTSTSGNGVNGTSTSAFGVSGTTGATNGSGVLGDGTGTGVSSGVMGRSGEGSYPGLSFNAGVTGRANANVGVQGLALSGIGVYGNSRTSLAGLFENTNAANGADALQASTNGTASSWALRANSTGLQGAGIFQYNNAVGSANALRVLTNGTGFAANITSSNATPFALRTQGGVQLSGINEGLNRILTSDATGNATWQNPAAVGVVTGSGTLNFVPKWTPNGTNLGNSQIFDNGTRVGVGTTDPAGVLRVAYQFPKTNVPIEPIAFFTSNEPLASSPFGLRIAMQGGASLAARSVQLQTTDYFSADGGALTLQAADGNVGIGTTTPLAKLDVSSGASFLNTSLVGNSSIGTWLSMGNTDPGGRWFNIVNTATGNGEGPGKLVFFKGSAANNATGQIMTFDHSTSNVGIGTNNPFAKLDVSSGGSFLNTSLVGSSNIGTWFSMGNTDPGGRWFNIVNTATGNGEGPGKLIFFKGSAANNTTGQIMTFDHSTSNVGIGTNNPSAKLAVNQTGAGLAGSFTSTGGGISILSSGTSANTLQAQNQGTGAAGLFQINNPANSGFAALNGITQSQGPAGQFIINNAASSSSALRVFTNGIGFAGSFTSSNGTPKSLFTQGGIQLTGLGEANNFILRSDAAGNATWVDPATVGVVSGSGTLNYIPKWTPNGTTLGNSLVFDDGTNVGIGTSTPSAQLNVNNAATGKATLLINQDNELNISAAKIFSNGPIVFDVSTALNFGDNSLYVQRGNLVSGTIYTALGEAGIMTLTQSGYALEAGAISGVGIFGSSSTGTAIRAYAPFSLALRTQGAVRIEGQGAAAGYVLTSDAVGNATWQDATATRVAFAVRGLTSAVSVPLFTFTPISQWSIVDYEEGSVGNYNAGTGEYTVPKTGKYHVSVQMLFNQPGASGNGYSGLTVFVNGVPVKTGYNSMNSSTLFNGMHTTVDIDLTAGQLVQIRLFHNTSGSVTLANGQDRFNTWSIHLIK